MIRMYGIWKIKRIHHFILIKKRLVVICGDQMSV